LQAVVTFSLSSRTSACPSLPVLNPGPSSGRLSSTCGRVPFTLDAICLLQEHIHCIWTLPEQDSDYSLRWKEIKRHFTRGYLARVGPGEILSTSRQARGEAAIWQRRFWEHSIRSDQDLNRHIDYLHYNPVRHGLVKRPVDWPWSSFHRFVKMGTYDKNWGEPVSNELLGMACGE